MWIALEKQPEGHSGFNGLRKESRKGGSKARPPQTTLNPDSAENSASAQERAEDEHIAMSVKECGTAFRAIEARLGHVEAFITSKKFRLHCEINRI
jgi:hypothetical protein